MIELHAAYYATYVLISLGITVWVGRTLNRNGLVFLVETFQGKEALANSINHLLLVGFYLINLGFVSLALRLFERPKSIIDAIELLSTKVGLVIVLLGVMHFFTMYLLMAFRRSRIFHLIEPRQATPRTAMPMSAPAAPAPALSPSTVPVT